MLSTVLTTVIKLLYMNPSLDLLQVQCVRFSIRQRYTLMCSLLNNRYTKMQSQQRNILDIPI